MSGSISQITMRSMVGWMLIAPAVNAGTKADNQHILRVVMHQR